jgi:hypothetical protein
MIPLLLEALEFRSNNDQHRPVILALEILKKYFIFYGKGGEFASNRLETQELSVLSLHLLQISMVYVNTLMIQSVLDSPHWQRKLTANDKRAITPLIFSHVNPYGTFKLDMKERISRLTQQEAA